MERLDTTPVESTEQGSSLVELLIATVILLATLGPLITVGIQSSRMRVLDGELALAFSVCRNNLEDVRALPFSTVPSLDGRGFVVPGENGQANGLNPVPGDPDGLPGQFLVTTEDSFGGEVLYRVRVSVRWTGILGPQQFELDTLIADRSSP